MPDRSAPPLSEGWEVGNRRPWARRSLSSHRKRLLTEHEGLDEKACHFGPHDVGVDAQAVGAAQHVRVGQHDEGQTLLRRPHDE